MVEQNNELLMKNHESRPIGSIPFPEANVTSYNVKDKDHTSSRGRGCGHERGGHFRKTRQKWDHKDGKNDKNTTGKVESLCYRYGGLGDSTEADFAVLVKRHQRRAKGISGRGAGGAPVGGELRQKP
ncbi:protein SRG1-like [Gossypium australe]|uniref:Protein SRG1-like n=1 Tax=Gossypium australe TaxID=47621 RepID=A0A5B6UY48_9ROSI|nr:protein SRG1-like [Gossypium australe]